MQRNGEQKYGSFEVGAMSVTDGNDGVAISIRLDNAVARITYDMESHAQIYVPNVLSRLVNGLCGDYNGDSTNDIGDNDDDSAGYADFGNSWKMTSGDGPSCPNSELMEPPMNALLEVASPLQSVELCGFDASYIGAPLLQCILSGRLPIVDYTENCILDVLANQISPQEKAEECLQNNK